MAENYGDKTDDYYRFRSFLNKTPKTWKGVFIRFAEYTSFQGIPFIYRSRHILAKLIWIFFFTVALACTIGHYYLVASEYLKRGVTSKVMVGYSNLPFPSVSICNINPIRQSAVGTDIQPLRSFLDAIEPRPQSRTSRFYPHECQPTTRRMDQGPRLPPWENIARRPGPGPGPGPGPFPGPHIGPQRGPPVVRQGPPLRLPGFPEFQGGIQTMAARNRNQAINIGNSEGRCKPPSFGEAHFLDVNLDQYENYLPIPPGETVTDKMDKSYIINAIFQSMLGDIETAKRMELGHQLEKMLIDCSFGTERCTESDFYYWLHPIYGNCFTFNSHHTLNEKDVIVSGESGANSGLKLKLYIQRHDYLKSLTSGFGMRVDVHPYGTMPFVEETGMSVSPGTETFLGLKMINSSMLGHPYNECNAGKEFKALHNSTYTIEACRRTCMVRKIIEKCSCYPPEHINNVQDSYLNTYSVCTRNDIPCKKNVTSHIEAIADCNCVPPCSSVGYDIVTSYNPWPNLNLWPTLVDTMCYYRDEKDCEAMQVTSLGDRARKLEDNFVSLKIYYRDLNFQSIEEIAEYELVQFVADIGGVAGLWIGASLLSYIEILDLLCHVIWFGCRGKKHRSRGPTESHNYSKTYSNGVSR